MSNKRLVATLLRLVVSITGITLITYTRVRFAQKPTEQPRENLKK